MLAMLALAFAAPDCPAQVPIFPKSGNTICGRVLDEGSHPMRGARAAAVATNSESPWVPPTWTDDDGKFCLKDLKAGVYTVTVSRPGYLSVEQSASLWTDKADVADIILVKAVGDLTDLSRIVIHGNTTFTEKSIRSGLLSDRSILLASHPMAPRQAYIAVVVSKILDGYKRNGFPNATVAARLSSDGSRINVEVTEGARYTNGEIVVSGTHVVNPDELKRLMREERIPYGFADEQVVAAGLNKGLSKSLQEHSAVAAWPPGGTADFSEEGRKELEADVQDKFAEMGYWSPSLTVNVVPVPGTTTASLVINVKDEGRTETIRQVHISGNKKKLRSGPDGLPQY